jgi:HNH endonuclease
MNARQIDRFDSLGIPDAVTGCVIWTGSVGGNGYGLVWKDGVKQLAHRVAYERKFGPIPDGMFVCHHCDTRRCIKPEHLFLGTQRDNMADMHAKGRGRAGEFHKAKTHCPHGHELSGENVAIRVHSIDGHRYRACRECGRQNVINGRRAKKAATGRDR